MSCFVSSAFAQDVVATSSGKDVSPSADMLQVACQLVKYGYQTKSALPLIQALEIYKNVGLRYESEAKTKTTRTDGVVADNGKSKDNPISFNEKQLIADATSFADGDKSLLALIKGLGGDRGSINGPTRHFDRVLAYSTDTYPVSFRGGEDAYVVVSGDGDSDLDLYVYDQNGNLITFDRDGTDDCVVSFVPNWTGPFFIQVKNLGGVYNNYVIATN